MDYQVSHALCICAAATMRQYMKSFHASRDPQLAVRAKYERKDLYIKRVIP